ncbi:riboflavin synthase [Megalodesulfovibrio paquesii]
MFTGLVQTTGRLTQIQARGDERRLFIESAAAMPALAVGESIAVNGACLTVEAGTIAGQHRFGVYASGQTLSLTTLGALRQGDVVNLERALAMGDRLGGHMVAGHVDCIATVTERRPDGESTRFTLSFPAAFGPQVVDKGSVALDGISLTITGCGNDWLAVNIIPATITETTISRWTPGSKVNMETDVIAKYVQKMLAAWNGAPAQPSITEDFLRSHGF